MYNINISNTMHVLNWARSPKHCCFLKCIILSIYILLDIPKFFLRPLQVWDKEVWMYRYFQLVKLLWIIKKYFKKIFSTSTLEHWSLNICFSNKFKSEHYLDWYMLKSITQTLFWYFDRTSMTSCTPRLIRLDWTSMWSWLRPCFTPVYSSQSYRMSSIVRWLNNCLLTPSPTKQRYKWDIPTKK